MALAITAAGCGAITSIEVAAPPAVTATELAPPFALTSHEGQPVRLADALSAGHVVLVFYRGHW
jgi:cytochrome oxidase Cu insertion factor (SCO1/SenC/PrrC family)